MFIYIYIYKKKINIILFSFFLCRDSQSIFRSLWFSLHNLFYCTYHFSTLLSKTASIQTYSWLSFRDQCNPLTLSVWVFSFLSLKSRSRKGNSFTVEVRLKDISNVPCFHLSSQLIFAATFFFFFCVVILLFCSS